MNEKKERAAYSARETADALDVDIKSVYAGIKARQIPSIKIGNRVLVPASFINGLKDAKA